VEAGWRESVRIPGELRTNWRNCARLYVVAGQAPSGKWIITVEMTVALCALLRDPLAMQQRSGAFEAFSRRKWLRRDGIRFNLRPLVGVIVL
jgi:hypothetical protein